MKKIILLLIASLINDNILSVPNSEFLNEQIDDFYLETFNVKNIQKKDPLYQIFKHLVSEALNGSRTIKFSKEIFDIFVKEGFFYIQDFKNNNILWFEIILNDPTALEKILTFYRNYKIIKPCLIKEIITFLFTYYPKEQKTKSLDCRKTPTFMFYEIVQSPKRFHLTKTDLEYLADLILKNDTESQSCLPTNIFKYYEKTKKLIYTYKYTWYEYFGEKILSDNIKIDDLIYYWSNLPETNIKIVNTCHPQDLDHNLFYVLGLHKIIMFDQPKECYLSPEEFDPKVEVIIPNNAASLSLLEIIKKDENPIAKLELFLKKRFSTKYCYIENLEVDIRILELAVKCLKKIQAKTEQN